MKKKEPQDEAPGVLREAASPAPARSRRLSLAALTLAAITGVTVVLAAAGAIIYQIYSRAAEISLQQRAEILTSETTYRLAALIQQRASLVEVMAREGAFREALAQRDAAAIAAAEQVLQASFPGAARARLIPAGMEETGEFPQLGYADLDLMRTAEQKGTVPPVEAHLFGGPGQHIDIIRPVRTDGAGQNAVLGHVLVSYGAELVQEAVDQLNFSGGGRIEVRQRAPEAGTALTLAARGGAAAASDAPPYEMTIPGTNWLAAYWPGPGVTGDFARRAGVLWAMFAGVLLALAAIAFLIHRAVAKALREDLANLVSLVRELRSGRDLEHDYRFTLKEFDTPAETLITMSQAYVWGMGEFAQAVEAAKAPPSGPPAAAPPPRAAPAPLLSPQENLVSVFQKGKEERSPRAPAANLAASIFRAYDIRGVVGETLTRDVVYDIGRALGSEAYALGQQSFIVARDGRLSGPDFVRALSDGLRAAGRDVIDIGCVPTPVLYFATHYLNTGSGVMVTGSHNPPEYNGLKMVLRGETLAEGDIQALRARIEAVDFTLGEGSQRNMDVLSDYIHRIASDVDVRRPFKVVVDCGNGVAGEAAPRLLRALGCDVIELYCDIDGNFPNHHPDPSQPENIADLIAAVKEYRADLGLAFDGDGDRLALVDDKGRVIWPDRQMMLYSRDILARNPGALILFDVKCTRALANVIARHGGKPLMWKTGHSLIKRKMRESGALLGGEMSGHIFFKERWYGFDDALYTAARLLEILSADPRPVSAVCAELPDAVSTPELRIDLPEGAQITFMQTLLERARLKGAAITTIDGLRADFEDGWGLVRASNTTPSLILRFEGVDAAAMKRVQEDFRRLLLEVDAGLRLPF